MSEYQYFLKHSLPIIFYIKLIINVAAISLQLLKSMPGHCINVKSIFGYNKDLIGGVHSLFDE